MKRDKKLEKDNKLCLKKYFFGFRN